MINKKKIMLAFCIYANKYNEKSYKYSTENKTIKASISRIPYFLSSFIINVFAKIYHF